MDVRGQLKMARGAGAGKIMTSDAAGVATWQTVGPSSVNWRGAWDTIFSYAVNDIVTYQGGSYRCLIAHGPGPDYHVPDPSNDQIGSAWWEPVAIRGFDGADGVIGEAGYQAMSGAAQSGIGWVLLPVGTASVVQSADTGAFTRNVDGTVTVRDAGWYSIQAIVNWTAAAADARRLARINLNDANADNSIIAWAEHARSTGGNATFDLAATRFLPAGAVLRCWGFADTSTTRNATQFAIARLAAGPAGPAGATTGPPIVSALPTLSLTNGQEVYLLTAAMITAGVPPWHCRYRATNPDGSANANTNKWDVVGAVPWRALTAGDQSIASDSVWRDPTTVTSITPGVAGVYYVHGSASGFPNGVASTIACGIAIGATDPSAGFIAQEKIAAASERAALALAGGDFTLTAAQDVRLRHWGNGGGGQFVTFGARSLVLTPIRLG